MARREGSGAAQAAPARLAALRLQSQTPRLSRQQKAPHGLSFDALRSYGVITADQFDGLLS